MHDVDDEIVSELLNAVVFADQPVLEELAAFVREPSKRAFVAVATAMRSDLWGKGANVSPALADLLTLPDATAAGGQAESTIESIGNSQESTA